MQPETHRHIANDSSEVVTEWSEIMMYAFFVYFITDHLIEDSRVVQMLRFLREGDSAYWHAQRDFLYRVQRFTDRRIVSIFRSVVEFTKIPSYSNERQLRHLLEVQKGQKEIMGRKRTRAILTGITPESLAHIVAAIFQRDEELLRAHNMDFEAAREQNQLVYQRTLRLVNIRSAIAHEKERALAETSAALYNETYTMADRALITQMADEEVAKIAAYREVTHEMTLVLDDLTMRHARLNSIAWQGINWLLHDQEFSPIDWFGSITEKDKQPH